MYLHVDLNFEASVHIVFFDFCFGISNNSNNINGHCVKEPVELRFRIPIVSGIPDILSRVPRFLEGDSMYELQKRLDRTYNSFSILFSLQAVLPKLIDSVNNIINRQLSFGYDVGKGYIIAEEEIIKLIDHMVVDERIAKDLKQRSEQNRLNAVKSLGKQARLQLYSSCLLRGILVQAGKRVRKRIGGGGRKER